MKAKAIARLPTNEVLNMVLGDDFEIFGRMPVGLDESEFDAMPPKTVDIDPVTNPGLFSSTWQFGVADPRYDVDYLAGDDPPAAFESPGAEQFPIFKEALAHFKEESPASSPSICRKVFPPNISRPTR
jgi:hypothetical protein